MRPAVLAFAVVPLMSTSASADCEAGIAALTPKVLAVANNPHLRSLLEMDLKRAQFELWEFDEVECAVALEHAARLLKLGA